MSTHTHDDHQHHQQKNEKSVRKDLKLLPCYSYVVLAFQKLKHTIDLII